MVGCAIACAIAFGRIGRFVAKRKTRIPKKLIKTHELNPNAKGKT